MNRGWHWWNCAHCKGDGWVDSIGACWVGTDANGVTTSGHTTTRNRCNCCDGCGRVKVPDGYRLEPIVPQVRVISSNTANAVQS